MPHIRRVTAAAMLAGVVLVGSACSSSKGGGSTTTTTPGLSPATTALSPGMAASVMAMISAERMKSVLMALAIFIGDFTRVTGGIGG